jgi:uncharacterized Zn-binding protein involved in type VI secretion
MTVGLKSTFNGLVVANQGIDVACKSESPSPFPPPFFSILGAIPMNSGWLRDHHMIGNDGNGLIKAEMTVGLKSTFNGLVVANQGIDVACKSEPNLPSVSLSLLCPIMAGGTVVPDNGWLAC